MSDEFISLYRDSIFDIDLCLPSNQLMIRDDKDDTTIILPEEVLRSFVKRMMEELEI